MLITTFPFRELESRVSELLGSLEAFRESVRTKEQLIMRLCEEQSGDGSQIIGDSMFVSYCTSFEVFNSF